MSGKIIKYAIAGAPTAAILAEAVSAGIQQGWEPLGGIQVGEATVEADTGKGEKQTVTQRFFQAMVKRETIVMALN